ncbi:hypothetical protein HX99_05585 [Peptococcaceae bacterium SCADC1_2_3]|nr:hypothetical protein DK28_0209070 [Peptococcaceae bacterium SCADC1_2_3]KFI35659.1 hypothetical protein HX99_05585 [Peptococcaceae bacterium SCADC1_2_3]KFI35962.1 hypothetical protein HY00_10075 [Peptococcaceae bacterium SCADC1_2_3]KFI37629.1 hypothetical protein HY02_04880 [Peptococcaceae bacterium SCADC1_2_3]
MSPPDKITLFYIKSNPFFKTHAGIKGDGEGFCLTRAIVEDKDGDRSRNTEVKFFRKKISVLSGFLSILLSLF